MEAAWLPLAQGVHKLAKTHFTATEEPREQWLIEGTWKLMRKRTWLVDSLRNEADIAEVSADAVMLDPEIVQT